MLKRPAFQASVLFVIPSGLGPIKTTANFKTAEGKLDSISGSDENGFYRISLICRKKLNLFSWTKNKKSRAEKTLRQAMENGQGGNGNRSFCLKTADLPDETLLVYLGKKVRINPGSIEILA